MSTDGLGGAQRLYLEELSVGQRFTSGTHAVDAAQIKAFAAQFDPQPFHLDDDAAKTVQQISAKTIPAGQTAEFSAVVLDTYGSEDDRGLNVYKYRVRIVAGGVTNKKDPEILIDWP